MRLSVKVITIEVLELVQVRVGDRFGYLLPSIHSIVMTDKERGGKYEAEVLFEKDMPEMHNSGEIELFPDDIDRDINHWKTLVSFPDFTVTKKQVEAVLGKEDVCFYYRDVAINRNRVNSIVTSYDAAVKLNKADIFTRIDRA